MATVSFPDGQDITVNASPSDTDEEIYQAALSQKRQLGELHALQSRMGGNPLTGPSSPLASGLNENSRGIGGILGALAGIPGGPLVSMAGAGAGSAGEDLLRGDPVDKLKAFLSMLLSAAPGVGIKGTNTASKLRPAWMGKTADATSMLKTIDEAIPSLGPVINKGEAGLSEIRGELGSKRLSAYLGAERDAISAELPTASAYPRVHPQERFLELANELTQAHQGAFSGGSKREGLPAYLAGREASAIRADIIQLLNEVNPALAAEFKSSQLASGVGHEAQRALAAPGVLGVRGFNQGEMQNAVNQRLAEKAHYDPSVLKAIFRGGVPPRGDYNFTIPRTPIGMTYKAGPGANLAAEPWMNLIGPILQKLYGQGGP